MTSINVSEELMRVPSAGRRLERSDSTKKRLVASGPHVEQKGCRLEVGVGWSGAAEVEGRQR
ncbi:hypothetical protein HanXRQr2_Chr01g0042651 [Helianthus annuus]|uniref:Uncharacterized protein n=1 Tax=Helianthus annuus TaxID=4232 RepID=A0A9K3JZB6_HELAN|nr:hypothetical protein HanXRQr2_Chr01g0042651 [Helianthus annuus]